MCPESTFSHFPPPYFDSLDGPPRLPLPLAQADEQQLVRRSSSQETASARSRDSPRREGAHFFVVPRRLAAPGRSRSFLSLAKECRSGRRRHCWNSFSFSSRRPAAAAAAAAFGSLSGFDSSSGESLSEPSEAAARREEALRRAVAEQGKRRENKKPMPLPRKTKKLTPPTSLSQNQKNSPLPRGPSRSSQRQRQRQRQ